MAEAMTSTATSQIALLQRPDEPPGAGNPAWWSRLAFLCGLALPLEAVVISTHVPVSIALVVPACIAVPLLFSRDSVLPRARWQTLFRFCWLVLAASTVAFVVAMSSPIDWTSAELTRGWLRAPIQLGRVLLFAASVFSLTLLASRPTVRVRLLHGFAWSTWLCSAYALADFGRRFIVGEALPQIGNDPTTAGRRLAAFSLEGSMIPRVSGSSGEPKGFSWILVVYLILWLLARSEFPRRLRSFGGVMIVLAALVATFSTTGWIVALAVLHIGFALPRLRSTQDMRSGSSKTRIGHHYWLLVTVPIVLGFAAATWAGGSMLPSDERLSGDPIAMIQHRTQLERFERPYSNIQMALEFSAERPFGWGLGNYHLPIERNLGRQGLGYGFPGIFLHTVVEGGLLAGILQILAFLSLASYAKRRWNGILRRPIMIAGMLICFGWIIRSLEVGSYDALLALGVALVLTESDTWARQ